MLWRFSWISNEALWNSLCHFNCELNALCFHCLLDHETIRRWSLNRLVQFGQIAVWMDSFRSVRWIPDSNCSGPHWLCFCWNAVSHIRVSRKKAHEISLLQETFFFSSIDLQFWPPPFDRHFIFSLHISSSKLILLSTFDSIHFVSDIHASIDFQIQFDRRSYIVAVNTVYLREIHVVDF